jgi:hypothetical protein
MMHRILTATLLALLLACPASADSGGMVRQEDIRDDAIGEQEIDWGSATEQVAADDMPVIDAAARWAASTVEGVLAEIGVEIDGWSSGAPPGATYLVLSLSSLLANERQLTMGDGLAASDGGANGAYTINIAPDGVDEVHIDWGTGAGQVSAADVPTDTTSFDGVLSASDTTVQAALETLDEISTGGGSSYWTRTGTELTPATSGDNVEVNNVTGLGASAIYGRNTGTGVGAGVGGRADGTGGDGVQGFATGSLGTGVEGNATGANGIGVFGEATATGGNGVMGIVSSTAASENDTYGGTFTRTHGGTWLDLDGLASTPANPSTGDLRVYGLTADDRLYMRDDAGNAHDLTVAAHDCWPAAIGGDLSSGGGAAGVGWAYCTLSGGGGGAVPISAGYTVDTTNYEVDAQYLEWGLQYSSVGGYPGLVISVPFRKQGDAVVVAARVWQVGVDAITFGVSDDDNDGDSDTVNDTPANATWKTITHTVDASGFTDQLRAMIFVEPPLRGDGEFIFRLEWIEARQWVN